MYGDLERALHWQCEREVIRDRERVLHRFQVETTEKHCGGDPHLQQRKAHADALSRTADEAAELEWRHRLNFPRFDINPPLWFVLVGVFTLHALHSGSSVH